MRILIVGNGGREHALAWKVAQEKHVTDVFVAPGNAGTATEEKVYNIPLAATDITGLIAFAKDSRIDLTIIGPEAPLAAGIVDAFTKHKLACFGPCQQAAQLESSKSFAKAFMQRHQIPTASSATFDTLPLALDYIKQQRFPLVIKADGLASGKGVVIAENLAHAEATLNAMFGGAFAAAGQRVVIEEFLHGQEASYIVICDGDTFIPLASSQDHKARDDGDKGPNTGGMGAYSPAPIITPEIEQRIISQVIAPTLAGLASEGIRYQGFLYAGLMLDNTGNFSVLEFNCRLGDPETQVILPRMQSSLADLCLAAQQGKLAETTIHWDSRAALGVVLASRGYPDSYPVGDLIQGLPTHDALGSKVFHAATAQQNQDIITAGGRVLCVTCLGTTLAEAKQYAYQLVESITWPNKYYRKDIGHRAC